MGNGKASQDTGMVHKFGQMEQSTKAFGRITKLTEKEPFGMFMATSMKVFGREIEHTVAENTPTVMEQPTRESGSMIYSMVRE